jgi:hypothetical protein
MTNTDTHSTIADCHEALTAFQATVERLPLESPHRANSVLGLIHQLRGRLSTIELVEELA